MPSDSAPYRSTTAALSQAFYAELSELIAQQQHAGAGGGGMRPEEWIAQARMVLARVDAVLPQAGVAIVAARFLPASLTLRRVRATQSVADYLVEHPRFGDVPEGFVEDCVRRWVGMDARRTDEQWSSELRKNRSTLHRWRNGSPRGDGMFDVLDRLYYRSIGTLTADFREHGIIPED